MARGARAGGQALPQDAVARLDAIGRADVVVGIPSIDGSETIAHVVTAVEAGLRKYLGDLAAVICISDAGSTDGTVEVAFRARLGDRAAAYLVPPSTPEPQKVGFVYRGPSGKGSALRAVFEAATRLGARACAVVDSDLRSITPTWIDRLLTPVIRQGFEYVAPLYARHKYDGTITNSIAYPLTAALYGARIRQPIGGEFGLSGDLFHAFAAAEVWETDVARFGVDVWMTTQALAREARVCQAILGAKLHDPRDPGSHLGPMFRQVVGTLFWLAGLHRDRWWEVEELTVPPTFGFPADYAVEPIEVSLPRLTAGFVDGSARFGHMWRSVLSAPAVERVQAALVRARRKRHDLLPAEDWLLIVCDYLVAHQAEDVDRAELLDSLIPLYFARTATFVEEAAEESDEEAEARVEAGVELALDMKPYLRERWPRVPATPR